MLYECTQQIHLTKLLVYFCSQVKYIARSALMQISGCCFTSITITCIKTSNFTVKLTYIIIIKSKHVCVCEHMKNNCFLCFRVLIKAIFWFKKCYLVFNLFVTSKNETTNSPIHNVKVLHKGQEAFKSPFLMVYYFLSITLKTF